MWHRCHFLKTKLGYIGELQEGKKQAIYSLFLLIFLIILKKTVKHRALEKPLRSVDEHHFVGDQQRLGEAIPGGRIRDELVDEKFR